MFNLPTKNTDDFTVGTGILFLGPTGQTPTIDVGVVRGGTFNIVRAKEKIYAGSPLLLVDSIATQEDATFSITSIAWNLSNVSRVIGDGVTVSSGTTENLEVGGTLSFDKQSVLFRHRTKAGHTIFIKLWEATGIGSLDMNFPDTVHEFPYAFEAQMASTDWAGDSLGEDRRLFEIERQKQ